LYSLIQHFYENETSQKILSYFAYFAAISGRAMQHLRRKFRSRYSVWLLCTGDFHADSDVDLLLLFDKNFGYFQKDTELYNKVVDILSEHQVLISLIPISKLLFETKKAPLYINIKKEGVELWKK